MPEIPPINPDYQLWMLIAQMREAGYKARKKELHPFGLLPRQAAALGAIQAINAINGWATPAQISRRLFREPHSITELLNRMERVGLIRKTKDLDKKNLVRVSLTEKGQQALDLSMKRGSIYRIMSSLSEEQRQQLTSCLRILLDKALEELRMDRTPPFP